MRRPSAYQSSFALEEIDVALADGSELQLMFKDLSRERLLPDASRLKPDFLYGPLREIQTFSGILRPVKVGTPGFHGGIVDKPAGRLWLFLERVKGIELYQSEISSWRHAARWLATLHARCAGK